MRLNLSRLTELAAIGAPANIQQKYFGVTWDGDFGWRTVTGGTGARFGGTDLDWVTEAGLPWNNAVVALCLQYIWDKLIEPRVHVVYEDKEGLLQPIDDHPCQQLLLNPNPEYKGNALLFGMALSAKCAGNAYIVKVRGDRGKGIPQELWYIPHWQIAPLEPDDGGPTQYYIYKEPQKNGGVVAKLIKREDVIHYRYGIDPYNRRIGLNPMTPLLREIVTDNELSTVVAVVLRNRGVAGALISPDLSALEKGDQFVSPTPTQLREFERKFESNTTGDSRGRVIATNLPVKVDWIARSMKDLEISAIGVRPVARICSGFGIHPAAIGLSTEGGKGGQYGAMQREARESSYEQCMLPLLAGESEAFTYELLPDFPVIAPKSRFYSFSQAKRVKWVTKARGLSRRDAKTDVTRTERVNFDYSDVRDLQEDKDSQHNRANTDFKGGIVTLDEAREEIGLKPCDDPEVGEKFLWQLLGPPTGINVLALPGGEDDPLQIADTTPSKPGRDEPSEAGEDPEDPEGDDDEGYDDGSDD
jgi:hypothetical protein